MVARTRASAASAFPNDLCLDGPNPAAAAAGAGPARGLLRADGHRLAASQDSGRFFPGRRIAHLRPSHPVRGRRDDFRRTALRHRDHRRTRPRRHRRHRRRTRPGGRPAARAPPRHQAPLSGRLLSVRSHQDRPEAGRGEAIASPMRRGSEFSTIPAAASRPRSRRARTPVSASLVPTCPANRRTPNLRCWSSGRLRTSSRTSSRGCSALWAIAPVRFLPMRRAADLPPIGPRTSFLLAQPFLGGDRAALEERGATRIAAPFPLGAEGTTLMAPGQPPTPGTSSRIDSKHVTAPGRPRAPRRSRAIARCSRARRVFLFPDSQLEVPLARFLSREARDGAHRGRNALSASPASGGRTRICCRPNMRLSEGQHVERPARPLPRRRGPTSCVCGLGLANPLEAEGITTKWSIELLVHAHPGLRPGRRSRRAVRSAARSGARGWRSDAMQLTLWTYEGPPHVGAMRVATAMRRPALRPARAAGRHLCRSPVHDDRASATRPPVTYTTFQARDLGGDTAELFKTAARDAYERFQAAGDAGRRLMHRRAHPG